MSKIKTCPICGHHMPEELPPVKKLIFEALLEEPRSAAELRNIAGTYNPSSGNGVTNWCLYTHIHQLKKLVKQRGLTIRKLYGRDKYAVVLL